MNEVEAKELKRILAELGKENALLRKKIILIEEKLKEKHIYNDIMFGLVKDNEN